MGRSKHSREGCKIKRVKGMRRMQRFDRFNGRQITDVTEDRRVLKAERKFVRRKHCIII